MIDFGLTREHFRTALFEKEPHLFRNALREPLVSWSDLDELLMVVPPTAPFLRLFHHGVVPEAHFTTDTVVMGQGRRRLDKSRFYELMRNGATLVINRVEDYSVAAKRLCVEIGRFTGAEATGNAYVSFRGDGTFGKHWDTHDVFAIQLIGRKRWAIYPPTFPLPLTYQTHDMSGHACPAQPALELTLEQGDMLYLPRGWWHHVVPLDEGSLHLSVGIYPPTLYDYIVWTSARYLQQEVDVRRALSREDYRQKVDEALERLRRVLLDERTVAEFTTHRIGNLPLSSEFNVELFLDPRGVSLQPGTLVSLTAFDTPDLERGEIAANGSRLRPDPDSVAVARALQDCRWIRFDALCERVPQLGRDAVSRAVLNLARHEIVTLYNDRESTV